FSFTFLFGDYCMLTQILSPPPPLCISFLLMNSGIFFHFPETGSHVTKDQAYSCLPCVNKSEQFGTTVDHISRLNNFLRENTELNHLVVLTAFRWGLFCRGTQFGSVIDF